MLRIKSGALSLNGFVSRTQRAEALRTAKCFLRELLPQSIRQLKDCGGEIARTEKSWRNGEFGDAREEERLSGANPEPLKNLDLDVKMTTNLPPALEDGRYGYHNELVWNPGVEEYLRQAYGRRQFEKICKALTRPCITSTVRVNTLQATTEHVLEQLRQHLVTSVIDLNDTGDIDEEADSCDNQSANLNQEQDLEAEKDVLDRAKRTAMESGGKEGKSPRADAMEPCWEHPYLKDVVMVRGWGPCEVKVDCGGGSKCKEVVVSRKCGEAVLRGANVFVPGVLACSRHVENGDEVAVTVAVERPDANGVWSVGVTRGTTLDSEHAGPELGDSTRKGWFLGKGRTQLSRAGLFKKHHGVAIDMTQRVYDLPAFHGLLRGQIFLQNLPSIVAARVLDPQPGERVLDMCAAPGGKTTAIALLMNDTGEVVALDRSHSKVHEIQRLAEEMQLTCIRAYKMDATKAVEKEKNSDLMKLPCQQVCQPTSIVSQSPPHLTTSNHQEAEMQRVSPVKDKSLSEDKRYMSQAAARKQARKLKNMAKRGQLGEDFGRKAGFRVHSFDRVLLDAPCSALGLRPRLFAAEETLEGLRSHACYQRKMFDQAVQLVRPGGTIVYSTCTINPGENEAVVRYALDTYPFLSLQPQNPKLGGPGLVGGLDVFDGTSHKEWLKEEEKDLVQRFCPASTLDTIGFFVAKFVATS